MASLIEELVDTLSQQSQLYKELLEMSSHKKVAIIENNIPDLQKIVSKENTLVGRTIRLDKKRVEIFNDMATVLNIKDITLSNILEAIKEQDSYQQLLDIKQTLEDTLPKLKALNNQNQDLLQISMDYVEYSMNLIRGGAMGKTTYYDSAGNQINASEQKMFDARQ